MKTQQQLPSHRLLRYHLISFLPFEACACTGSSLSARLKIKITSTIRRQPPLRSRLKRADDGASVIDDGWFESGVMLGDYLTGTGREIVKIFTQLTPPLGPCP